MEGQAYRDSGRKIIEEKIKRLRKKANVLRAELARLRRENEELKVENNCLKAKIVNRQYAYLDPKPSEDGRA